MRDKSKFIAFIFSAIPGMAHLYIGLKERALIFFILLVVGVTGGIGLAVLTYEDTFLVLTIIGYLILWLIALIDVFSAWRNIEIKQLYNNSEMIRDIPDKKIK
jgi:predicted membrane protein